MLKVINPATGKPIREIEEDTPWTISSKYLRAKEAQRAWAQRPTHERAATIKAFRDLLVQHKEELSAILTSEMGKPIQQARNELQGVLGRIDFFLQNFEKVLKDEVVFSDSSQKMREELAHEPLGVIANISAWNYPYFVGSNVFIPALLTGNAVLYKPSEYAALTGIAIEKYLHQAGVPKDVFINILGSGAVGADLLKQPVNGVFFTGSYGTGKKIAESMAGRMVKLQLELGGKDPVYICEDVDVGSAAAATADGAFYNTGQSCCSVERIYVHSKIYNEFIEAFLATVRAFKIGEPMEESTYIGPLTREPQIGVLESQIRDALNKGARILLGGRRMKGQGFYFEPTVLVDVNETMAVMREESFGPIIGIQKVSSDEEAVRMMNDTDYGLTAGIYTNNVTRARGIGAQVNAGSLYWNCCDRVSPRLPWSGRGFSGMGWTLGIAGIQTFLQPKAWHLRG